MDQTFTDSCGKTIKNNKLTTAPIRHAHMLIAQIPAITKKLFPLLKMLTCSTMRRLLHMTRLMLPGKSFTPLLVDAATIAKKANVKNLIIGHFSTRYETSQELLKEAKEVFKNTRAASDGKTYEVK